MIVCDLCEWKRIYAGFSSLANICIAVGNPVMTMGMTGPGLSWMVIVRFVNIGGIDDYHCLYIHLHFFS